MKNGTETKASAGDAGIRPGLMDRIAEVSWAFDQHLARNWPALHVTRAHIVLTGVLLVYVVLLPILFLLARHTYSPPNPEPGFSILMILSIGASIGWLIYRGTQYRLLPVARRMGRARWIWLDLAGLIAVNSIPVATVPLLEWRMRAAAPRSTLKEDAKTLWQVGEIDLRHRPAIYLAKENFKLLWVAESQELGPSSAARYRLNSPKVFEVLLKYATPGELQSSVDGWVRVDGVERAYYNMITLMNAHERNTLVEADLYTTAIILFCLLLGLELWIAGLPALTGPGLLAALAFVVVGVIIVSIVAQVWPRTEYPTYVAIFLLLGVAALLALVGLIRRKSTLLTKASLGVCVLAAPLAGCGAGMDLIHKSMVLRRDVEAIAGVCLVGVMVLVIPLFQGCFNRLHAAPD